MNPALLNATYKIPVAGTAGMMNYSASGWSLHFIRSITFTEHKELIFLTVS